MSASPAAPATPAAPTPLISPATATLPAPTFFDHVWASITTPGAGPGLTAALNGSLCLLLLCLAYFTWRGLGDIHVAVLAALCVGLLISFNVFAAQVRPRGEKGD